jgi:hypothetical protein
MKFVRLVLRNLLRNRRRTILTALSIAVSMFVFCALIALPAVVDRITAAQASSLRLVCHSKSGLSYSLPESYITRIATSPHVTALGMDVFRRHLPRYSRSISEFCGRSRTCRGHLAGLEDVANRGGGV